MLRELGVSAFLVQAALQLSEAAPLEGNLPARPVSAEGVGAELTHPGARYHQINRPFSAPDRESEFNAALERHLHCFFESDTLKVYSGLAQFLASKFEAHLSEQQHKEFARLAAWREAYFFVADGWMPSFDLGLSTLATIESVAANARKLRPYGHNFSAADFAHLPGFTPDDVTLALAFLDHKNSPSEPPLREFLAHPDLLGPRATALALTVGAQATNDTALEVFDRVLRAWELSIEQERNSNIFANLGQVAFVGLTAYAATRLFRRA